MPWLPSFYAPGPGDRMEGPWATSRPDPFGIRTPSTLDDFRLGRSKFVTVASDPSRYGQTVNFGEVTYRSPLDNQTYTLPNVRGYIHDTGSAFEGRPDKLDIATGDFRGWNPAAASNYVAQNQARDISGAPEAERKSMPGLFDMFSPQGLVTPATGAAPTWNDALQARQNSLIGLGLGLMGGGWLGGMKGFEQGAETDAVRAAQSQRLRESALDRALRERHQAFIEKEAGITPFQRMQTDIARYRGTPQQSDVEAFYSQQLGTQATPTTLPDPNDPENKIPVLWHPRTQTYTDITGRPFSSAFMTAISGNQGTAAAPATAWPAPGGPQVTAPLTAGPNVPYLGAGGLGASAMPPTTVAPAAIGAPAAAPAAGVRGRRFTGPAGETYTMPENLSAGQQKKWRETMATELAQQAIPKPMPAELAARVGLASQFLDEYPLLRERVAQGQASYPNYLQSHGVTIPGLGTYGASGAPAETLRKIQSGADALLRHLTGAGMSIPEAERYVRRYEPSISDGPKEAVSKLDQLKTELSRVEEEAYRGRGGIPKEYGQRRQIIQDARDAMSQGAPRARVMQRLRQDYGINFMESQ